MQAQKISISLPSAKFEFIKCYQAEHHCKTRSEVVYKALCLLQQAELEACYLEANKEIDSAFDITAADGVDTNEAW